MIGSAQNQEEISSLLFLFCPLIDFVSIQFVKKAVGQVPTDMAKLLIDSEANFIRAMCNAIFLWEGFEGNSKLLRIHGRQDKVIPLPQNIDFEIDGGHLIAITHAEQCISAIIKSRNL